MQWLLTAIVWLLMVGGLAGYLAARGQAPLPTQRSLQVAAERVRVELRSTAALGGVSDPFALDPVAAQPAVSLVLRDAAGEERLVVVERLEPGVEQRVELGGLVAGRNEILIETAPSGLAAALQLRIVVEGQPQAEHVLWLEPDQPTVTVLPLRLAAGAAEGDHGH